jgi:hypothetical protein
VKSVSSSILAKIFCVAVLLCSLGAADIAIAFASVTDQIDASVTERLNEGPLFSVPGRGADAAQPAQSSDPIILETLVESEFEDSDPKDSALPTARLFERRADLARLMRAHSLCRVTTTSDSLDSRGPPHA